MNEFENIIFLVVVGSASLIITLFLLLARKKIAVENKNEPDMSDVRIFNTKIKLVPFLYLMMILIMFVIGIFSGFVIGSISGFIFASIPFVAYLVFDYKKDISVRKK